jgi:uncharacterized membrane protein YeaQ/YmgE (transglycosylase-associated protein family)
VHILWILFMGLIVGALARLLVPGRQPLGILGTIAVGVGGAFLGWWIGRGVAGSHNVVEHPWVWALLGSALLVVLFQLVARRGSYAGRWGRRW